MNRRVDIRAVLLDAKKRKKLLDEAAKVVSTVGAMGGGPHTIVRKVSVPIIPNKKWCKTCLYRGENCPTDGEPNDDWWDCWCGCCAKDGTTQACHKCGQTTVESGPPVGWRKRHA